MAWPNVNDDEIPDGDYDGYWGGCVVWFVCQEREYELLVDEGVKTPMAPCVVHVREGLVSLSLRGDRS